MSFTNELSIIPSSKEGVELAANQILNDLDAGTINPLILKARFKWLEKILEKIKPTMDEMAIEEFSKMGEKVTVYGGFNIRQAEFGTKYDYSNCGDPVYNEITKNIAALDQMRKDRETFLKAIKTSEIITDADTGETVTVYPPSKKSTTGLEFKL